MFAVEYGFLSTTTSVDIAFQYSGAQKKRGMIFEITAGRIDIGASIQVESLLRQVRSCLFIICNYTRGRFLLSLGLWCYDCSMFKKNWNLAGIFTVSWWGGISYASIKLHRGRRLYFSICLFWLFISLSCTCLEKSPSRIRDWDLIFHYQFLVNQFYTRPNLPICASIWFGRWWKGQELMKRARWFVIWVLFSCAIINILRIDEKGKVICEWVLFTYAPWIILSANMRKLLADSLIGKNSLSWIHNLQSFCTFSVLNYRWWSGPCGSMSILKQWQLTSLSSVARHDFTARFLALLPKQFLSISPNAFEKCLTSAKMKLACIFIKCLDDFWKWQVLLLSMLKNLRCDSV